MMGFGSFANGDSSLSPSNLSAFAPPFTAYRPVSLPNSNSVNEPPPLPFDTTDTPLPWTAYYSPWVPSVSDYYASFNSEDASMHVPSYSVHGQYPESVNTTTHVDQAEKHIPEDVIPPRIKEINPMGRTTYDFLSVCPPDVSSQEDYTKKLSSMGSSTSTWDFFGKDSGDLESGKCTNSDWSFYSNKSTVSGPPDCHGYAKPVYGLFPGVSTSAKYSDVSQSMNVRENCTGSFTVKDSDGQTFTPQEFEKFNQYECSTLGASNLGTISTSTPAFTVVPPIGTSCYSQQKGWNYGTNVTNQNEVFSHKRVPVINNPHLTLRFEDTEVCPNPSRFSAHFESNGLASNHTINKDEFTHVPQANELHVSHTGNPERFPLVFNEAKASDFVESSCKSSPTEDSPCWKGATFAHFSPFHVSETVVPYHLVETSESLGGSNGPQILPTLSNDAVRDISRKLSETLHLNQNSAIEKKLAPSINVPLVPFYYGLQHTNTVKPFVQEESFITEKNDMNINDASENYSLHGTYNSTEDRLSDFCGKHALNKPRKLHGEESTPKMDVPVLVKTIHNLSDLLMFSCSNDVCGIKEQDRVVLKNTINNLNACMLKSSPDLLQGNNSDKTHVTKIVTESSMDMFKNQRIHEEKRHNILMGKRYENFQDPVAVHNDADMVKIDGITKAIKNVFVENFNEDKTVPQALLYKNLWLEAEAVICSTNFRARFDRIKNEMENCRSHEAKDVSGYAMDVENFINSQAKPDITVNKLASTLSGAQDSPAITTTSYDDDVLARFHILKCRDENSTPNYILDALRTSSSNICPDLNEAEKLVTMANDSHMDSPAITTTNHGGDVLARFRILKCRDEISTPNNILEAPKTSSSNVSPDLNEAEKLVTMANDSHMGSPITDKKGEKDDFEDSVMARFHMLKLRGEILESRASKSSASENCVEDSTISSIIDQEYDNAASVMERLCILTGRFDKSSTVKMGEEKLGGSVDDSGFVGRKEHSQSPNTSDKLFKDGTFDMMTCENAPVIEELGNEHSPGWYESPTLDWEHVLKDDFAWQK